MAALRPQLETIANRHRLVVTAFHDRLDRLTDAQLRWAPDDKTWSIVLIVDHLIKVHAATSPVFMKALLAAPAAGDEVTKELRYSFSDRLMVQLLSPGGKFKLPEPSIYMPVTHRSPSSNVVQHLQDEFEAFRVILEFADGKRLKGVRVSSPTGSMRLSIVAYLDAIVQHNRYHLLQIEALLRDPKFPRE